MKIIPSEHYGADYFYEGVPTKLYHDPDGSVKQYIGPAREWHGFGYIAQKIMELFPDARTVYDVGCGCGSFVKHLRNVGFDAYGSDISKFAVTQGNVLENTMIGFFPIISCANITDANFVNKINCRIKKFDLVLATDLLEHIYYNQLSIALKNILSLSKKYLFFCIGTADKSENIFILREGEEVPVTREWQAVAGHVTVLQFDTWLDIFTRLGVKISWDKMRVFEEWRAAHPELKNLEAWNSIHVIIGQVR